MVAAEPWLAPAFDARRRERFYGVGVVGATPPNGF
jgi:hypothetical protein